jgi:uncharacterized protein YgiM (DUF1202 family)
MPPCHDWTKLIALSLLLGLVCSCAKTPIQSPGPFYVTQEITYLKETPEYGGNVLGPLYRGDKVERVDVGDSSWWRVTLLRTGQTGYIPKELLSPEPVSTVFFYVKEATTPLLECPRHDCMPLQMLYQGDQVQKVEEGDGGWCRVLAIKSRTLGWVPAAALSERMYEAMQNQPPKPYFYVAVSRLSLRAKPSNRGDVVRTLRFNDQVQRIGQTEGWLKVRQPSSGAVGWVISRDLETLPLVFPRDRGPAKNEIRPFKPREEPSLEPEFM